MKKILLVLTILLASISLVTASIQVRPYLGYGFGVCRNTLGTDSEINYSATPTDITKNENIYYSGGAGLNFGAAVLYGLTDNLGVELGIGYISGTETEIEKGLRKYTAPQADGTFSYNMKSSYIPIDISIKFSTKVDPLTLYLGFGPTLALGAKATGTLESENCYYDPFTKTVFHSPNTLYTGETEISLKTGMGYNASISADYDLNDSMALNFGFLFRALTLKLDEMKITKYEENGVDQLATKITREKEFQYEEDNSDDDNTQPGKPEIKNTEVYSFSSLTFTVGIAFKF